MYVCVRLSNHKLKSIFYKKTTGKNWLEYDNYFLPKSLAAIGPRNT